MFAPTPKTVEVVDFNPTWSFTFEEESIRIKNVLGSNCLTVHHIGSTSVGGLAAKPIIDMLPVVSDILQLDNPSILGKMEQLGYTPGGENGLPFRRFFSKINPGDPSRTLFHVHVYQIHNPEIEHHLAYRDYLRANPEVAGSYAEIKRNLAQKYPNDMGKYCREKSNFITEIGTGIEFSGLLLRDCYTEQEWTELKRILQIGSGFLPNPDEFYFVFYMGISKIIAAAHIGPGLEIIELKIDNEGQEYEMEFNRVLDQWKKHKTLRKP